jgi:hypothetical protein
MDLYKFTKDILIKLILLLKNNYESKINNLENKMNLCEKAGIRFDCCNERNCKFMEIRSNSLSKLYQCYSCKYLFCEHHISYCETCEDFMCLDDINICQEYHKEIDS